jgi:hypothetical protein
MSSGSRWKFLCAQIAVFAMLTITAAPLAAQTGKPAPFKDLPSYLAWMQKNHKAPFIRNFPIAQTGARALQEATVSTHSVQAVDAWRHRHAFQNVQVNQDRNPWPKAGIAAAVNPSEPNTWLVMSNDFRENVNHMFYHVSTDRGRTWTDDALTGGADPFTGTPLTEQSNPGVSFDNAGNSYFSSFSGNLIVDSNNNYLNLDSEVDEVQGLADGTYSSLFPTPIDTQSCSGMLFGPFTCDATLSQPSNSTDANPNSPNAGTTYVYYTYFCNLPIGTCTDGNATIPAFGSVILESHSAGPGGPFSVPSLVSGALATAQFSDMVIDPSGTPHIFFDDFTNAPVINMWESTLTGGVWTVSSSPVATFTYSGLANPNWGFSDSGAAAPGCGIHHFTAYCAFSANQVSGGRVEGTPSVYLASVNVSTGASRITRVNNDAFNDLKDHFFAWATATPAGAVYVGWYDDRHDSLNTNVEYFVGRSFDEGRTFPIQKAVNDIPFNPCNGFPGCGYFGDYTQLVSGPDGVVHAAWSDTRDGSSMQIWSQIIHF